MSGYTSYLSNILTQTTSRYNSLRKALLNNEDDGDTEDDSHISRVLRAYYTEKGRSLPQWLPPDPNDRRAVTPAAQSQGSSYLSSFSGRSPYAGVQQAAANNSNRGSLNDLWDAPAAPAPAQPQSLRAGRRAPGGARPEPMGASLAAPQARPLPSQRAGSYQSIQSQASGRSGGFAADPGPPASSGGAATAQERLKARLWGRSASPGSGMLNSSAPANPYDQQAGHDAGSGGGSSRRYGRIS